MRVIWMNNKSECGSTNSYRNRVCHARKSEQSRNDKVSTWPDQSKYLKIPNFEKLSSGIPNFNGISLLNAFEVPNTITTQSGLGSIRMVVVMTRCDPPPSVPITYRRGSQFKKYL